MKKEKWPSVSFIVCTYNCKDYAERCFKSIKEQDYPGKIEMIASDGSEKGHSTDGTVEVLKGLGVKIVRAYGLPEGKAGAKYYGYKEAKGEIIIFIDSDNKLMEKDWTRKMVNPVINDKEVNFAICRMAVVREDIAINRYLSLIGTDPFVDYKSIDSQLALKKLKLIDKGEYYLYKMNSENFLITGGYYFTAKKETLEKIGGYTQDTDVVYNLVRNNLGNVAIVKDVHLHHLITKGTMNFFKKKIWWGRIYFEKQKNNRDFSWMPQTYNEKLMLYWIIIYNLLFFPKLITGIKRAIIDKESAWLLHPYISFITTIAYIYAYLTSK